MNVGQMEHAENAEPRLDYCQSNFEIDRLSNQRQNVAVRANSKSRTGFGRAHHFQEKKKTNTNKKTYRLAAVAFETNVQKDTHKKAKIM